ncbi:MAG TPA: HyaD/HybD family hydrogenase maturation endopeptidase [Gemmatimonadales bacterium]|nr:HyaD/HybD family hydrogenase maturation endopeptidase [Gemmatimonadales bacterium]
MSESGTEALVIGLGNPIMADDGLGIAALERLREGWMLAESVRLVDGGTWGMNLLPLVEAASELLLLDAIDRGEPAGQLTVLERDQIPRFLGLKLSPHQVDLREVLALAELRGGLPEKLVAMGLQPARVEMFAGLSPGVEAGMGRLLAAAAEQLERWGHSARRLEPLTRA